VSKLRPVNFSILVRYLKNGKQHPELRHLKPDTETPAIIPGVSV
jgi:hypothetical protein